MPFPSEGGHGHDVGWHIWLVWILELKIFGCHSIVFALQKGFVKLQMANCSKQTIFTCFTYGYEMFSKKDKKLQKYGKGLVIGVSTLSISYVILT